MNIQDQTNLTKNTSDTVQQIAENDGGNTTYHFRNNGRDILDGGVISTLNTLMAYKATEDPDIIYLREAIKKPD